MTRKKTGDDESQLFLDAVRDVKRIRHPGPELHQRTARPAVVRTGGPSPDQNARNETSEGAGFTRSGVQLSILRKLRREQIPIEDELDLHGYSSAEAGARLRAFLACARRPERQRAVRIIHGKGHGSPDGKSVLKQKTQEWLREDDGVLAFCPAPPSGGGSGAVNVLLRKKS
jgi:DNA-nicking Smr family endonuclease